MIKQWKISSLPTPCWVPPFRFTPFCLGRHQSWQLGCKHEFFLPQYGHWNGVILPLKWLLELDPLFYSCCLCSSFGPCHPWQIWLHYSLSLLFAVSALKGHCRCLSKTSIGSFHFVPQQWITSRTQVRNKS